MWRDSSHWRIWRLSKLTKAKAGPFLVTSRGGMCAQHRDRSVLRVLRSFQGCESRAGQKQLRESCTEQQMVGKWKLEGELESVGAALCSREDGRLAPWERENKSRQKRSKWLFTKYVAEVPSGESCLQLIWLIWRSRQVMRPKGQSYTQV